MQEQVQVDPSSIESDLFAPRLGHHLSWRNLSLTVGKSKILHDLEGHIAPRQICGIMGHSGSGKTSLLHVLSGKVQSIGNTRVTREVKMNGTTVDPSSIEVRRRFSCVAQYDSLPETSTVREAITFSARMRSVKSVSDDHIKSLVDSIMDKLRLTELADKLIGGAFVRGLSGGEMRRVSLGVELIVRPSIVFLDEVTSGLDSFNATTCMEVCRDVANAGATVVMVIHQPTSDTLALMDRLIFLKEGKIMYQGDVSALPRHVASLGFPVPDEASPVEWMMKISLEHNLLELDKSGFFTPGGKRHSSAELGNNRSGAFRRLSILDSLPPGESTSMWTECCVLTKRELLKIIRNKPLLTTRVTVVIGAGILHSLAFFQAGRNSTKDEAEFTSNVFAVLFLAMSVMFVMVFALIDIESMIPLFLREYTGSYFRLLPFAVASITSELITGGLYSMLIILTTFWTVSMSGSFGLWIAATYAFGQASIGLAHFAGSLCTDPRRAKEIVPGIMLMPVLFSGILQSGSLLPGLGWIKFLFPFTYYIRLLLSNEFSECLDYTPQEEHAVNCMRSLANVIETIKAEEGLGKFYEEQSTLTLAQTGSYKGQEDILEYFDFFSSGEDPNSSVWNACPVKGSRSQLRTNFLDASVCDVTLASIHKSTLNPEKIPDGQDATVEQYVFGNRVQYTYSSDLSKIAVENHNLYYPIEFVAYNTASQDAVKISNDICETLETRCPDVFANNNFTLLSDCTDAMEKLPLDTINKRGLGTIDGNSLGCRNLHASLATRNAKHCPHISFISMEDEHGKTKCQEEGENNYLIEDFFSPEDVSLFKRVASSNGLDDTIQHHSYDRESDSSVCFEGSLAEYYGAGQQDTSDLPPDYFCSEYLYQRNATGESNITYWLILVGMYFVFRFSAFGILRFKASRFVG